jgi:hypothetical protein
MTKPLLGLGSVEIKRRFYRRALGNEKKVRFYEAYNHSYFGTTTSAATSALYKQKRTNLL